jgi:predicted nucleotidyltransferase
MLITRDMTDFVRLLKKNKVRYMLVGGFAVIYYGYVRTTQDIDILVLPSLENAEKMLKVLKQFGFGGAGITRDVFVKEGTAIHLGAEPNRIDILTSLRGVSNRSVFAHAKRIRHKGISLNVISFSDLLACKKHSTRPKDIADVDMLEKTAKRAGKAAR